MQAKSFASITISFRSISLLSLSNMRRSLGFQQQCYGNGNGHGHGYDGMWGKSQDQMQHYEVHEESWESRNSGMNMRRGGGGWHGQVDNSEYSGEHHATFGRKGSHGQLQQAWHGGNGAKKWQNPSIQHGHGHGHGGNFNSNSSGHFKYVSEDELEFESYSTETHGFPGANAMVNVNEMRYEHHNLGKNKNWNPKAEWLNKGV